MVTKSTKKTPVRIVRNKFLTGILTLLPIYITYVLLRFIIEFAPDIPYLRTITFFSDKEVLADIIEFIGALLIIFLIGIFLLPQ